MGKRPYLIVRRWTWKDAAGNETPGIGLMYGTSVKGHLTVTEARTMADRLHDLADAADNGTESHSNSPIHPKGNTNVSDHR